MAPKRKTEQVLEGKVFAITGTLSMKRDDFVSLIEENGGTFAKSVTKAVTHLVSADPNTQKAIKARATGVEIVQEAWVLSQIGSDGIGGTASNPKSPAKKTKSSKAVKTTMASSVSDASGGEGLSGLVFCITGTLSVSRNEFKDFIQENGGTVVGSVTGKVTHLVSARSDTTKAEKARDQGVEIVDEAWVRRKAAASTDDDSNDDASTKAAKAKSSGTGARMYVFGEPYQAVALSRVAGGWSSWEDGKEDCMVGDDMVYGKIQQAPATARKIATKLNDALDGVVLPAGESDTEARVVVITTDGSDLQDCVFNALGVKSRYKGQVTWDALDLTGRKVFCYDEDECDDEDLEEDIVKGTTVLREELQDHFEFNFTDELVATPRIYGGVDPDGNIVAILSFRVWT